MLEGQIQTDDEALKDRVRALQLSEVLILRGDKENSLAGARGDLNKKLMSTHLSCLVVPHKNFQGRNEVKSTYLGRYLAIYVLYKSN